MFRKIISSLSFSPAIAEKLADYATASKKEESMRRMGLVLVAVALSFQILSVIEPPKSLNVSSSGDFIYGGVDSLNGLIDRYDKNSDNIKDLMDGIGIKKSELLSTEYGSWAIDTGYLWNQSPAFSSSENEHTYNIYSKYSSNPKTIYARPASLVINQSRYIKGWIGVSRMIGWFIVDSTSGNIITSKLPKSLQEINSTNTLLSISAINLSQKNTDATKSEARPGDNIQYTITAKNTGSRSVFYSSSIFIADVLEYSSLSKDTDSGTLNSFTGELSWQPEIIESGKSTFKSFTVMVLDNTPLTSVGTYNRNSFDCKMSSVFGYSISIDVQCPFVKKYNLTADTLPSIDSSSSIAISTILFTLVGYLYARTRLINHEIRLARRQITRGTI